ncbi:MAG: hypothetical protein ABI591_29245 [Kofleriaceae bacterium]
MFLAPPMPDFAPGQFVEAAIPLRYEDLTQTGSLMPIALPSTMSPLWRDVLTEHPGARNALKQGVIPILTRMVLVSVDQPIHVNRAVEVRAGFELAHDRDAAGEVTRLFMNVWTSVRGAAGRISPNSKPGGPALAGHLFAEHTFTRLLAPPDQRKVTRLEVEGYPNVPTALHHPPAPATAQEPPAGARWIDELLPDTTPYQFTLDQTDSNQHVNSLVYIRMFLDAVNRRLASAGHRGKLRSRAVDIAYRKPSFAGDAVRAQLRLYEGPDGLGAAGFIAGDDAKPRVYVRVAIGA